MTPSDREPAFTDSDAWQLPLVIGGLMAVDRYDLLVRLQSELIVLLDEGTARDAAALSKELRAITAELESLPTAKESTVDDLAKRRASRRAEATG